MNKIMYLKRLEDFTPQKALKALKASLSEWDRRHIRLSTKELNYIQHGICDQKMIKYVVSIGDGLYQIVAIDNRSLNDKRRVSVVVDYFQLAGTRYEDKKYSIQLEEFTPEFALEVLKNYMSKHNSNRDILEIENLNCIQNGICDNNMIKYVVSTGYGIYQIAAIKEDNRIYVVVKYSQV